MHVKASSLKPDSLSGKVAENVRLLRERYGKPVLVVETGYYCDRALEANQWLSDFIVKLMAAGAAGIYYWEPELTEDNDLGAWNPLTRHPSIVMDAFLGLRHREPSADAVLPLPTGAEISVTEYYSPTGMRLSRPTHGLNIIRQRSGEKLRTYKVFK